MPDKNPFFGATFAERKAIREAAEKADAAPAVQPKAVDAETNEVEDKAVTPKKTARKSPAKKRS